MNLCCQINGEKYLKCFSCLKPICLRCVCWTTSDISGGILPAHPECKRRFEKARLRRRKRQHWGRLRKK